MQPTAGPCSGRTLRVLFLCTGNSCRSQIAEAWARHLKANVVEPYSAGTHPHGLDPLAVKVMAEVGLDISRQPSKALAQVEHIPFDYVVTVCSDAHESCPVFPSHAKVVHIGFDDPPRLAAHASSEAEALTHYRRVRDEIRALIEQFPNVLLTTERRCV
jgi:arsenate reductase (thioredoxin)